MKTKMQAFSRVVSGILEDGNSKLLVAYSEGLMFGGNHLTKHGLVSTDCSTCLSWLVYQSGKHAWAYEEELGVLESGLRAGKSVIIEASSVALAFTFSYFAAKVEDEKGASRIRSILSGRRKVFLQLLKGNLEVLIRSLAAVGEQDLFS